MASGTGAPQGNGAFGVRPRFKVKELEDGELKRMAKGRRWAWQRKGLKSKECWMKVRKGAGLREVKSDE